MNRPEFLIFAVTNDLSYDQRMIRICTSLAGAGYRVTLVGRKVKDSVPLSSMPYSQLRLRCFFNTGFFFYAEFNLRLFFYLLWQKPTLVCAIDLDTILPCFLLSKLRKIPRVYDAHELFCEMKEVVTRPGIHLVWKKIEIFTVPRFLHGYTVSRLIAEKLNREYNVHYHTIRNVPVKTETGSKAIPETAKRYILYQGAVNEGRAFETLIPAFNSTEADLIICGNGNFMNQAKQLVKENRLEHKIQFTGWVSPDILQSYTRNAYIGVNIIENIGLNSHLSLSNRFFDYIQSGLPQVCVGYPAYREIIDEYNCALLIDDTNTATIAAALNRLLNDETLYNMLRDNCIKAASILNWDNEEQKLISFYKNIFEHA